MRTDVQSPISVIVHAHPESPAWSPRRRSTRPRTGSRRWKSWVEGLRSHRAANTIASCSTRRRSGSGSIADSGTSPPVSRSTHSSRTCFAAGSPRSTASIPASVLTCKHVEIGVLRDELVVETTRSARCSSGVSGSSSCAARAGSPSYPSRAPRNAATASARAQQARRGRSRRPRPSWPRAPAANIDSATHALNGEITVLPSSRRPPCRSEQHRGQGTLAAMTPGERRGRIQGDLLGAGTRWSGSAAEQAASTTAAPVGGRDADASLGSRIPMTSKCVNWTCSCDGRSATRPRRGDRVSSGASGHEAGGGCSCATPHGPGAGSRSHAPPTDREPADDAPHGEQPQRQEDPAPRGRMMRTHEGESGRRRGHSHRDEVGGWREQDHCTSAPKYRLPPPPPKCGQRVR